MIVPFSFGGGGFSASTLVREPSSPTRDRLDAGVAGRDLVERLLLRAHDRLQARVARLVDRVADADHGGQLDLDGVVAVLGLALAVSLPSSVSILITCVSDGICRWSATTAPIV